MDYFLAILASIFTLLGILGCVVPGIPGVPLNYLAIIMLHFTRFAAFNSDFFILWGGITLAITILDYSLPRIAKNKLRSTSYGRYGAIAGAVAGLLFFPPYGVVAGPLIGAFAGEYINKKEMMAALRSGFSTFLGFLAGSAIKLIASGYLSFIFFKNLFVN